MYVYIGRTDIFVGRLDVSFSPRSRLYGSRLTPLKKQTVFLLYLEYPFFHLHIKAMSDPPTSLWTSNVRYGDGARSTLDIYVPQRVHSAATSERLPMIFYVHGGGWIIGSKTSSQEPARALADQGYVVFAPSYTLTTFEEDQLRNIIVLVVVALSVVALTSPTRRHMLFVFVLLAVIVAVLCGLFVLGGDHTHIHHPRHIQDVAKAFRWMVDHAQMYHGDTSRVIVSGHSAGGHLVALLCTNGAYLQQVGLSKAMIRACVPISGVFSDERLRSTHLGSELLKAAFSRDILVHRDAFPIHHVDASTCPFLLINAKGNDISLKPHSYDMFYTLLRHGVYVESYYQPDTNHFSVNRSVRAGQRNHSLILKIHEFIQDVLNG
jgi:acetyl esterase/lipase